MSAQQSFFATVASFAKPFDKANAKADPIAAAHIKFATVCEKQIKEIKAGAAKGFCFKKRGEGYVVTLKNGPATLNAAQPSYLVANADAAAKLFETANKAAQAGEFDELFKATARTARKAKAAVAEGAATGETGKPAAAGKQAKK